MPFTPMVARPIGPHLVLGEADRLWPRFVAMRSSRVPSVMRGVEELVALLDLDADDALLAEVLVLVELGLLDLPVACVSVTTNLPFSIFGHLDDGGDLLARLHPDEVHDRAALAVRGAMRDLVDLLDVDLPLVAEEEDVRVGRRHEELGHPVLLARLHPDAPLAAALLGAVVAAGSSA